MLTHCSLLFCGSVKNLNFTLIDASEDKSLACWGQQHRAMAVA